MNKINTNMTKKAAFNYWKCINDYNWNKPSTFYVPNLRMSYAKDNERGGFSRWMTSGEARVKLRALLTSAEDKTNLSALRCGHFIL